MDDGPMFSSSTFSYRWTYDVFLSFRGLDTRHGFTGHLYKALSDKGIHTFFDDQELQTGEEITPALVNAIQQSRIAIIVFSNNYASSSFCLAELSTIIECVKANDRLVLPVFYDVDPSHVRHQRGTYGEALAKHEHSFKEKVPKWRMALHQAANLSGCHFKHGDGYEHEFIGKIVEEVSRKIKRIALPVADYPVGLENQVLKFNLLLDVGSDDGVHMIGIYGIGGMGKTTLALAVYNFIADHFEGLCFLENVRENSTKHGLQHLQKILLSEIVGEKKIKLTSIKQGISMIQYRLQRKKVLLILDDVDKQEQLNAIAGKSDWFGPGSRVIITTRDKHLLARHGVERIYEVEGLNETEALELLSWKAFKTDKVSPSYLNILNRAVNYTCGLPLALEVIGSNLFGKSIKEWESALDRYKRIPDKEIQRILKVSFDALEKDEQSVFLDIACCFKGYELAEVEHILGAHYGDCMKYHIGVLVEKSLIKISRGGIVTQHDLIEDMGKEIVRQESPKELGKRSRLWIIEDIVQVLEDNNGTSDIEIIHLDFPLFEEEGGGELEIEWDGKAFKKMKNLKTLIIRNVHFFEGPKHLPNSLRVLEWWRYPSQYLPSNFHPKKLAILKLPYSCSLSLELAGSTKKFVNLRVLNFDHCECLTELTDLSGLTNLEELSFEYCENLTTVHHSVGFLDKLKVLSALSCRKLRSFPPIMLTSLEEFHLSECDSLENFPEILGKMENIRQLQLDHTAIKELPLSFKNLTRLRELRLCYCKTFEIPSTIVMMPELAKITAWRWKGWLSPKQDEVEENDSLTLSSNVEHLCLSFSNLSDDFFPTILVWFANVKTLDLSNNSFTTLPACIKECRFLRKLLLNNCQHLREIKGVPPNLEHFSARNCESWTASCTSMLLNQELHEDGKTMFTLPGARIPEWFEHHSKGPSICFWFRNKFPAIALCLVIGLMGKQDVPALFSPMVTINGNKCFLDSGDGHYIRIEMDHIFLFDLQTIKFEDNLDEALLENEWNYVEVSYTTAVKGFLVISNKVPIEQFAKESGIHVFNQKSTMEDIRFTDPFKRRKLDDDTNSSEIRIIKPAIAEEA